MEKFLLKLLLWPWAGFLMMDFLTVIVSISVVLIMVIFWTFVLLRVLAFVLPSMHQIIVGRWPRFLVISLKLFSGTLSAGILGLLSNTLARLANGGRMPVFLDYDILLQIYSGHIPLYSVLNPRTHMLANEHTSLNWLCDYINVDLSPVLLRLFDSGPASPGDLMLAAGVIFSWWIVLVILGWSIYFVLRRLLSKIYSMRKK